MSRRASPAIVGAFVLGAVGLLLIGLLVLGGGRLFRRNHTFVAYFRGSVTGLVTGAAVKFKGVDVGAVRDVQISIANDEKHPEETRIPVLIDLDERKLVARGAIIDWDDPTTIARLIKQGLRVQLATASYVTGIRYIALDIYPGSPAALGAPDPAAAYPELPVMASGLEEVQRQVDDLLARLARVDITSLVAAGAQALDSANDALRSVQHAAAAVDALVSAPELKETIGALRDASVDLRATIHDVHQLVADLRRQAADVGQNVDRASASAARVIDRAAGLMASAQGILSADAPLVRRLEQALSDLSDAARSFRRLTDKLERDPGAILRGGDR